MDYAVTVREGGKERRNFLSAKDGNNGKMICILNKTKRERQMNGKEREANRDRSSQMDIKRERESLTL